MKAVAILSCLVLSFLSIHAQERFVVTSDSVTLYVNVRGTGPACLYIHGGPGSGSYWLEEFMGDSLERQFQMIYLDQRGVGRSSSPEDDNYSLDRMVRDFEEVRESLGIQQWLTLGHSFGGILQMGYINREPSSIAGMIFINCSLYLNDSFENSWLPRAIEFAGDSVPAICHDTSVAIFERMKAVMPVLNAKGEMWKMFYASKEDNRRMNDTYRNFASWNNDLSEKVLELPEYWDDFRPLTPNIQQPVLFYFGTKDWAIGPEHYKGAAFPNMLLWGSEAGHMPFLESKEDLAKAIRSFTEKYHF